MPFSERRILFNRFFSQKQAEKRNFKPYSPEEILSITRTGRSTDINQPFSRQSILEITWLINEQLLALKPKTILEIGTASGGTSLILSTIFPNSKVYGLDLTDALHSKRLRKMNNFDMTIGNSMEDNTLKILCDKCSSFDFILIDGDHSEIGVLNDFHKFKPLLNNNGLMVFHDVRHEAPKGIKSIYYKKIKPNLPGAFEYFINENNNGYGLWYNN